MPCLRAVPNSYLLPSFPVSNSPLKGRALIASVDLVSLAASYGVQLTKEKGEYVGLCPFHADNNPSFYVNPKKSPMLFCCTPCSMGGNALEFVIRSERARGNFFESKTAEAANAYRILEEGTPGAELPAPTFVPSKPEADLEILSPVPASAPVPVFNHNHLGLAAKTWAYRDAAGQVLYYTARFDKSNGDKDVLPLSYVRRGEKAFWKWQGQHAPRPLYGLDLLAKFPGLPVLVVEGEKTADAANKLYAGKAVAITWPGGFRGVRFADWSPLAGRLLLVWPDNDAPGRSAMLGFWKWKDGQTEPAVWQDGAGQYALAAGAQQVKAVRISPELPEGWDVADGLRDGWDSVSALAYLKDHVCAFPERDADPTNLAPTGEPEVNTVGLAVVEKKKPRSPKERAKAGKEEMPQVMHFDGTEEDGEATPLGLPYRPLGYRKNGFGQNEFWIYSFKAKQALCFSASKFTKSALLQLADEYYWIENFEEKNRGYETGAAECLMNECYAKGYFDPELIRGIGAWIDEGRVVVHAGTHVVESGEEYPLQTFESKFLYEANRPFGFTHTEGLPNAEAAKFSETVKMLAWERPAYADLFLGWCVIAPVCGALHWRPHIWVTGPAGSGKTTVMDLLRKVVGSLVLPVQGNTSEAAIRQSLNQDARPVCFDEADSDGFNDSARLQSILSLVRSSSSHDGGSIIKGGAGGTAQSFVIRSCFAFASITPKTANAADRSRVTVLTLTKPPELVKTVAQEHWAKIEAALYDCFSPERCERLRARTLALLPQLLQNAKIFARAATVVLGESRAGDQLGTLLAGAYSLKRSDVVEFEYAKQWIAERNWDEIRNDETDELTLLAKIMEQQIRVRTANGSEHERTIGELILIAAEGGKGSEVVDREAAYARLNRIGIRVEQNDFYVSNTADWLQKTLRGTAWATNHSRVLVRLPGAENIKTKHFGPGVKNSRAIKLPISLLTE